MESSIVEEYLEAVYKLQGEGKRLGSTELSRELNVSPASATEMMSRLSEKGLVKKSAEAGITLTRPVGMRHSRSSANIAYRNASSWTCWEWTGRTFTRKRAGSSTPCPPRWRRAWRPCWTIPIRARMATRSRTSRVKTPERHISRLSGLKPGRHATIAMIAEEKRDLLEYLATLGMMPRNDVVVEQVAPFDGPLTVKINGTSYALGREIAEKIWVQEG